jgi:hypothetical protein
MISVIVCSINPVLAANLKNNIQSTIGIDHEIICIDNRIQKKGICEVYNEAAKQATFDVLCFIHEDVFIHSNNWGMSLLKVLSDETIGLVGVSGTIYKSGYPSVWPACDHSFYRTNTIQHFKNKQEPVVSIINPFNRVYEEVAVLDGVFLATKKSIFNSYFFDEKLFKNFHCYDLDISFNIGSDFRIVVMYDILLEHFSEGSLSRSWVEDSIKLHEKWKQILPRQIGEIEAVQKKGSDFISCQNFLSQVLKFSSSKKIILTYYLKLILRYRKYNHFNYSKTVFKSLLKFRH